MCYCVLSCERFDRQRSLFLALRMGAEVRSEKVNHTPLATAPDLVAEMILPCSWRFGAEALTRLIPQHSAQAVDERCAQEEHS